MVKFKKDFLVFTDASKDHTTLGLFNHVTAFLKDYNCENKLTAQMYEGAVIMAGEVSGLNKRIQDVFPSAIFTHCYSHSLNLTLQQSVANIKERRFFSILCQALQLFFLSQQKEFMLSNNSSKRNFPQ